MSVYAINNPLSNGYGVNVQQLRKKLEEAKNPTILDTLDNSSSSSQYIEEKLAAIKSQIPTEEQDCSGTSDTDNLAEMVEKLAGELGIDGKITYNKLLSHKNELTGQFQLAVKTGLAELGVAPDADFRISLDENGELQVSSNHKDKAKIEQFFKDNPQLAERYGQIQTLNKLEEARSSGLQNISDTIDTTRLVSYMNRMGGTSSALAMTGEGSLAALLNTGFKLTV